MLRLKDLEVFVAAYDSGGFGRAADALDTAQSQVSLRVRRLESLIGAQLFERLNRGIKPTAKGRLFYRHAKRVFEKVGELEAAIRNRDAA